MKTKKWFKIGFSVVSFIFIISLFSFNDSKKQFYFGGNDFLTNLRQKLMKYNEHLPEDRVYLQFDKPFYKPGETIWFSAWVRNGIDLKKSKASEVLHVELINPRGNVTKKIKLIARNGTTKGDFTIGSEMPGGIYKVKAYTNWQKNDKEPYFFEKEIQVQEFVLPNLKMKLDFAKKAYGPGDNVTADISLETNANQPLADYDIKYVVKVEGETVLTKNATTNSIGEQSITFELPKKIGTADGLLNVLIDYQGQTESISRSIPIVLNQIDLTFYPEGGDWISNFYSNIAFRAVNEFGKPADIEGIIIDAQGNEITNFETYHQGMGACGFKPVKNKKYFAQITKPKGIEKKYELPAALPRGYVLNVQENSKNAVILKIQSTEFEDLSLALQVRGEIYYTETFQAIQGKNIVTIPTENLPVGVAQITLFDSKNIERAERLVFVNKHKQLNIEVKTDKEMYLPREKVEMTINVTDERGIPMPGSFALSVTNDQLIAFADDKSGNILSEFLLQQDLNEKVEEPAFYFDNQEQKANLALDYLLMTSGWRRFKWVQITEEALPTISNQKEKTILKGKIYDASKSEPIKAKLKFSNGQEIQSDKNGVFEAANIDLYGKTTVEITAKNYAVQTYTITDYSENLSYYIYPDDYYLLEEDLIRGNVKGRNAVRFNRAAGAAPKKMNEKVMPVEAEVMDAINKKEAMPLVDFEEEEEEIEQPDAVKEDQPENANVAVDVEGVDADKDIALFDEIIVDNRGEAFVEANKNIVHDGDAVYFYRAKEFSAPVYEEEKPIEVRSDFRTTIFWEGTIEIDRSGEKVITFYNSDDISSFRATVEGIATDGSPGRTEYTYYTQMPFSMRLKVPVEVVTNDIVSIPLTLVNNTDDKITGTLTVKHPEGLKIIGDFSTEQAIAANSTEVVYLDYQVENVSQASKFFVSFKSGGFNDAFKQEIRVIPQGFPTTASISGSDIDKEYLVNIQNLVSGSLNVEFNAFPSVVSDLLKGVESILREPYGCFEQTSMSSYPNLLVMDYMKTTEYDDPKLLASAETLLDKGYKRLTSYECSDKGYEWFGGSPAHEALTAYGLMQFNDMKTVYDVDEKMIERTAQWLFTRKNGRGGFKRNPRALDSFGGADDAITNAYIVYALSEAGYYQEIEAEYQATYKKAIDSKDPYQYALLSNAAFNMKQPEKGNKLLKLLYEAQAKDGSLTGLKHSITRSTGNSLTIETTSLAILAMIKSGNANQQKLQNAVKYLVSARSGYGAFGSTQGTVLALKALTNYAKYSKKTDEAGTIEIYVGNKKVAEKSYEAGQTDPISIAGLEKYLEEGTSKIRIKYKGVKNALPYSMAVSYFTSLPKSSDQCVVSMKFQLENKNIKVGETSRLTAILENTDKSEGQPMTMMILGIPAGLSAQPWQLKELQEKKIIDYYETSGNNIALYFRDMAPAEVIRVNLDLKAEIPGEYQAPASTTYLYYTNEHKQWLALDKVTIKD